MEKATNSASFPITSEPHKSVVQIILPKNNNKSENLTQCSNLFEWIEEKKKKINFLFRCIIKRRNRRGSNISAIRKQKMREKYTIAIIIEGAVVNWKYADLILVIAFISQIPIRIWAIFVVKGCYDFYLLLNVFVTLAEK
ncbi:hypothetical protein Mgra_00006617 [Meloidogyne graminicola]|uniref:Transmembrane protein n=1 Tax=Meloidogyne graminicola TaxID=189291 RepID=A0A8S9ZL20_9BILA|nr:hypothetical protein Mgra_00006617 [Meloidogyne graminicola]